MKIDKDVAESFLSGNPTCDIAAVARMASPVGGGVAGGIREKTRWFRPSFHNGWEARALETQERSWVFCKWGFGRNENHLTVRIVHLTCVSLAVSDVEFVCRREITCSCRLSRSTLGRKRQACAGS